METPTFEPGLTFVVQSDGRGRVVPMVRIADAAETLWIVVRGAASTPSR